MLFGMALVFGSKASLAFSPANSPLQGLYVALLGGAGSTTWDGLVPAVDKQNDALMMSTPQRVMEGGFVWGVLAGYEFTPFFALEMDFRKYPKASIFFAEDSLFTFDHDGEQSFISRTESMGLMAKIMLVVPRTNLRVYSSAGFANVHREDNLCHETLFSPAFGVGALTDLNEHLFAQLGFHYVAGYGESDLNPSEVYIPFLYSGFISLGFRF